MSRLSRRGATQSYLSSSLLCWCWWWEAHCPAYCGLCGNAGGAGGNMTIYRMCRPSRCLTQDVSLMKMATFGREFQTGLSDASPESLPLLLHLNMFCPSSACRFLKPL